MTLWPNGTFSLSYKYRTDPDSTTLDEEFSFVRGFSYRAQPKGEAANLVSTQQSSQPTALGEGRKSKKYGLKGITRLGTKMVRSGAWMLQKKFGKNNLCFLTITVPTLNHAERKLVAQEWGDLMRQTLQYLTRRLQRANQPALVVSVTELQSARLKRYSQAYLHAHLVFPARRADRKGWCVDVSDFRTWWKGRIESKIGRELDAAPRVETKTVESNVEGYLGKYMTKGNESMKGIVDDLGEECVPGQQWNMTAVMRALIKDCTVRSWSWGEYTQTLIDAHVRGEISIPGYLKRVEIDIGHRRFTVAWVGNLGVKAISDLGLPEVDIGDRITLKRDLRSKELGLACRLN